MTNRHTARALSAAVPEGFDLSIAMRAPKIAKASKASLHDLTDLIVRACTLEQTQNWRARDQGTRATCNPFAVVAAEELWHAGNAKKSDPFKTFSEEYAYASMRSQDLPDHVLDSADKIKEDGSTFLSQAVLSLSNDGLLARALLPYRDGPNIPANDALDITGIHDPTTKVDASSLFHNVDLTHRSGEPNIRSWQKSHQADTVAQAFHAALATGAPVIASFAFLDDPADATWYGHRARLYGDVRYPQSEILESLDVVGGHTVCIIGYLRDDDSTSGSFVFKNSFGRQLFGGSPHLNPETPKAPLRGYGVISADDVNRYCWEYLYRSGH